MYFCYVDDSGASDGRTLTGLLVPAVSWTDFLESWLRGRAILLRDHKVEKNRELKGNGLGKTRGAFCDDPDADRRFRRKDSRRSAYTGMLESLAECEDLLVTTVACNTSRLPAVYGSFVGFLEEWAEDADETVLVLLDGKQGPQSTAAGQEQAKGEFEDSVRNAAPYRKKHRRLDITSRRVLEDPVMLDSRFSQPIQAADLAAYAAFQHLRGAHPHPGLEFPGEASPWASDAYRLLEPRWLTREGGKDGIHWRPVDLEPEDDEDSS